MSSSYRLAKKKVSQNDLRRLMADHKEKLTVQKKIISPLAKYTDKGQLTCLLCDTVVRSEAVWNVHINAKQHKENVELAKTLKAKTHNFTAPAKVIESSINRKRPASPTSKTGTEKKIKSILKNSQSSVVISETVPPDFFDSEGQELSVDTSKKLVLREPVESSTLVSEESERVNNIDKEKEKKDVDESLPEGFFDDPILDAKVRNVQYKNPMEEEWEKFQKEMKEESSTSAAIIAGEHEEATAERQIDEIDEQMRNWHRVLDLEKKKEDAKKQKENENSENMDVGDSGNSEDEEFDEFLDWRAKKSFR